MRVRSVEDSRVIKTEMVMPNDTNPLGYIMGGRVLHHIDVAAAIAAGRHAGRPAVTATIDEIVFHRPVPMGCVLVVLASVNHAGRSSMEVGVRVEMEDRPSGERRHCASAYLTFVAGDRDGAPTPVPRLAARTPEEKRRMREAEERRALRLERRARKPKP
ncbi:MAG: acyl-CoA thioesterase [Planctomycetota bacterium]